MIHIIPWKKRMQKKETMETHQFVWQLLNHDLSSPKAPLKLIGHGHCPPWPAGPPWFRRHGMVLKSEIIEIWVVTWRKMHLSHIAFKVEFLISHRFRFSYYSWDDTPHLCSLATKEKSLRLQKTGIPSPKIECFFVTTHHHLCHFPWLRLDFGCFISQTHFQKVKLPTSSSC